MSSDFENRLRKVARHRARWAARQGLTVYRLYDFDVPGWPVTVDWYAGHVHAAEYPRGPSRRDEVASEVSRALEVDPGRVHVKTHLASARAGAAQYGRQSDRGQVVKVVEQGLSFECNLSDYLDTGLFLDHRLTRAEIRRQAKGTRFLNLFAYTGSFTVYARAGGAVATTTVDLSATYTEWTGRNLALNGLAPGRHHQLVVADALAWVEAAPKASFDLIVLDPPSFSTSRRMGRRFEVQRDHHHLVSATRALLAKGGWLYFSTNFAGFELDARLDGEEVTRLPEDCRRPWHRTFRFGP